MALFSEEMLLQGHFPLKFWVRSSWKESHMFENECQVFFLQCSYESQMFSCLFHKCHHAQQVQGAWEDVGSVVVAGPPQVYMFWIIIWAKGFGSGKKRKKNILSSVRHGICQHWKHVLRLGWLSSACPGPFCRFQLALLWLLSFAWQQSVR